MHFCVFLCFCRYLEHRNRKPDPAEAVRKARMQGCPADLSLSHLKPCPKAGPLWARSSWWEQCGSKLAVLSIVLYQFWSSSSAIEGGPGMFLRELLYIMPWVFKLAEVLQNQGKWTNDWTSKFQLHRSTLLRAGFWLPSWNRFSSIQSRCWSSVLASHSNHSKGYADWFWSNFWAPTESRLLYREAAMRSMWEDSPSMPQLIWGIVVSPESSIYALPSPRGASGFKFSD